MASINYATREISCKIVYYGPGLSGKTTNLQVIHRKMPVESKSEMVSLATETDRTLFFDFLPLDLGSIKGFATKFQLYTVPGQVYYNATRKLVLRGVDGVVFVADSQREKMQENVDSLRNLQENLKEYGIDLGSVPFVLQYNKRDLPGVATIVELDQHMNWFKVPTFEAQAHQGIGVFTTLKAIGKIVIDTFNAKYTARQSSRRPASLSDIPAPPTAGQPAPRPTAPPPSAAGQTPFPPPRPSMPPPSPAAGFGGAPPAPAPRPTAPLPSLGQAAPRPQMPAPSLPPLSSPMSVPPAEIPQPYPSAPQGAPQITGFVPPQVQQPVPGLQPGYFPPPQQQVQPAPLPFLDPNRPSPTQATPPAPGLQGFQPPPPPSSPFLAQTRSNPSGGMPSGSVNSGSGGMASTPSQNSSDAVKKKSRLDGTLDASDLDAEIARYERELADQKSQARPNVVANPNVNPNMDPADPMVSAFLTPEELTRLQGPDSYPTRRMPLGPGGQ